jgi:hypothetical protein
VWPISKQTKKQSSKNLVSISISIPVGRIGPGMGIMKTPTILSGHSSLTVNDEQAPPHKSERRPLKRTFAMLGNTPQIIAPSCTYGM